MKLRKLHTYFVVPLVLVMFAALATNLSVLTSAQSAQAAAPIRAENSYTKGQKLSVKSNSLNVRSAPKVDDKNILDHLKSGDPVTIIETKGLWCNVEYGNNKKGWVDCSQLKSEGKVSLHGAAEETSKRIVGIDSNLRSESKMGDNVVAKIRQGETVDYKEKSADGYWCKVNYNEKEGWMACKFLMQEKEKTTEEKDTKDTQQKTTIERNSAPAVDGAPMTTT